MGHGVHDLTIHSTEAAERGVFYDDGAVRPLRLFACIAAHEIRRAHRTIGNGRERRWLWLAHMDTHCFFMSCSKWNGFFASAYGTA